MFSHAASGFRPIRNYHTLPPESQTHVIPWYINLHSTSSTSHTGTQALGIFLLHSANPPINMQLPPGIAFVTVNAPRVILSPALAFCGVHLLNTLFHVHVPVWIQGIIYIASFPLALACSAKYADWRDGRQAAMHGALLAPQVPSKWPASLDLLYKSVGNFRKGYLGMYVPPRWSADAFTLIIA